MSISTGMLNWLMRPLGASTIVGLTVAALVIGLLNLAPALADDQENHTFRMDCPGTVLEGESFDVDIVRTIDHRHDDLKFGGYFRTYADTAGKEDYVHQNTDRIGANAAERRANKMTRTFKTRQDDLVEGDESFTVSLWGPHSGGAEDEPNENFRCDITIRDDDPRITGIEMVSTPLVQRIYEVGETIEFEVTFSHEVDARGSGIGMDMGDDYRAAGYKSGTGTNVITYQYTVKHGDVDEDGISVRGGGYRADGSTWGRPWNVTGAGTDIPVYAKFSGLPSQPDHQVNGIPKTVDVDVEVLSTHLSTHPDYRGSGGTYGIGETIRFGVTFPVEVRVEGDVNFRFHLEDVFVGDDGFRNAGYVSGSETDTLVFEYTVKHGDEAQNGLDILASKVDEDGVASGITGGGQIREWGVKGSEYFGLGRVVAPAWEEATRVPGHRVRYTVIGGVAEITSTPANGHTYKAGEVIQVTIRTAPALDVSSESKMRLKIGSGEVFADFASGSGTNALVFEYTVQTGDSDDDGITVLGSTMSGKVTHEGVNKSRPLFGSINNAEGHAVDATIAITDVAVTSDPGEDATYAAGDTIEITLTLDREATEGDFSGGDGRLPLDIGGVEKQAAFQSVEGTTAVFAYTVEAGDEDDNGFAILVPEEYLQFGGDRSGHRVDAVAPTVSSVAITSDPGDDDTYGVGDTVRVTVTFSEDVTVTGVPLIELDLDGERRAATYASSDGASVVFDYKVAVGDMDDDGIAINASALILGDASIRDAAGNDATLPHDAVAADAGHTVFAPGGL